MLEDGSSTPRRRKNKFRYRLAPGSQTIPGVNNIQPAVLEVCHVTRREFRPSHSGDGRDLRIRVADRSAERKTMSGNLRKNSRGFAFEPEDSARQVLGIASASASDPSRRLPLVSNSIL
jgi:hypothetical protein